MSTLLLTAVWVNLTACVLLTGSFSLLVLAGQPASSAVRQWEDQVLTLSRWMVGVALISGVVWLALRTALFEGRSGAAVEVDSIVRAMLNTWPGKVWMVRHALLVILAAFLWLGVTALDSWDRLAARAEALLLSAGALILIGTSSHSAAIPEDRWPSFVDMVHLLGAGVWVGGLPALALLLLATSRNPVTPDAYAVRTIQRFSRLALIVVMVLATSGIVMASLLIEGMPGLVGTNHGRLLLGKLAILLLALLLAAASRTLLPALSGPASARPVAVARRMALFVALEAGLVLLLLALAAAMTITTPARHTDPVWPWAIRLSLEALPDVWSSQTMLSAAGIGFLMLAAAFLPWRRRWITIGIVGVALAGGAGALSPLTVEAFPTSFTQAPVTYTASSIAEGMSLYGTRCAVCHGTMEGVGQLQQEAIDLRASSTRRRTAGELFWLTTHGRPQEGMPSFEDDLDDAQRWHLINYLRAADAASDPRQIGTKVELDNGWVVAPDFEFSVGALTPHTLREFRGRRMVLLVLYTLPESQDRITELARRYGALSVLGVEVIAVAARSSAGAIAELGANPPIYFPVTTAGNEDINAAYRLFAPTAAHAEFLIDRQGYIRAIWRRDQTGMPDAAVVQAEVERLNEEKAPPPLPDDHIH